MKSHARTDPANPFSFKHFISFNKFEMLPGSLGAVSAVRDDGTYPKRVAYQFSTANIAERTHPDWVERATNWLYGNEYLGYAANANLIQMQNTQYTPTVEPGAKWPRSKPEEFPLAIELEELPAWFKL